MDKISIFRPFAKAYSAFLFALCLMSFTDAYADNGSWSYLGKNDVLHVQIYMKFKNLTLDRMVNLYVLYDFENENSELDHKHRSEVESITVDCKQFSFIIRNVDWYESQMGTGAIVFNSKNLDWMDIGPDSVIEDIHSQFCEENS